MPGQVSVGHSMFFGLGAYAPLLVYTLWGWPPIAGIPVGIVLERRARRRHRHADVPADRALFQHGDHRGRRTDPDLRRHLGLVGAAIGLQGPARGARLVGPDLPQRAALLLYLPRRARLFCSLITAAIERRRFGFYLRAIKASERAARSLGVPVRRTKLQALALSAAFTSVAGSLYAIKTGFIDPDSGFGILISVQMVIVAALGGAGTLFGPLVGALILVPLQTATNSWFGGGGSGLTYILYGGIIVLIARFEPAACSSCGSAVRAAACGNAPMLLEAHNVAKAFGSFRAVAGADLTVDGRRDHRPDRPERRRQIDVLQLPRRRDAADHRPHRLRRRDVTRASPEAHARAGIGRTFQVPTTFEDMTVLDNVMVGAFLRHPHRNDARDHARRIVELTGLRADQPARSLGTPGRKRLEIARVLATEPRLLLLDEALAGLTPTELQRRDRAGAAHSRDRHHHRHRRAHHGSDHDADQARAGVQSGPRHRERHAGRGGQRRSGDRGLSRARQRTAKAGLDKRLAAGSPKRGHGSPLSRGRPLRE